MNINFIMSEEEKKSYKELYEKVKTFNDNNEKQITICPAICGKQYEQGGLMFVGRAINGWCPLDKDSNEISERIKRCKLCTLDWVNGENTWEHCQNNACTYAKGKEGNNKAKIPHTPFWGFVKYICLQNNLTEKDWYKKIVWSNLYKASYTDGGNPKGFYIQQIEECNKLLIEEIKLYKPKTIFFITEKNTKNQDDNTRTWFCEKYEPDKDLNFKKVYDYLRKHNTESYVSKRPEFHSYEDTYKKIHIIK